MKEKISIIIPCYNVENFVGKCIDSVLNQSYANIEVILINDGSTDTTLTILEAYKNVDSRIVLINQKNRGLSETRNKGIQRSTGAYIIFVDSDDWLASNYLEKLMLHIETHELVMCSYYKVFKKKTFIRKLYASGTYTATDIQRKMIGLLGPELKDPSMADSMVTVWGKIYQSAIIKTKKNSFVSTNLIGTEDLLFNLQYLENSKQVFVIDEPLYFYRKFNANSLTKIYKSDLLQKWIHLFGKIEEIIESKSENFHDAYFNRICLSIIGLGLNELSNPKGVRAQLKNMRSFLNNDLYRKSFSYLNFGHFPMHWKLFFTFAKYRMAIGVLLMLKGINYIITKNN